MAMKKHEEILREEKKKRECILSWVTPDNGIVIIRKKCKKERNILNLK